MRPLLAATLIPLALASTPALAGPWDTLQAQATSVDLSGPVELDLYTGTWGSGYTPRVLASFEDMAPDAEEAPTPEVLMLGSGEGVSVMSSGKAEALGLKLKSKKVFGAKVQYVVVPDLWLGADRQVHLQDLTFLVDQAPDPAYDDKDSFDEYIYLGLGTTGLAWAVRPSAGKVHFAPADQGASLLAAVGGTTMAYQHRDSAKIQWGKEKGWFPALDLVVQGTAGGQSVEMLLQLAGGTTLSSQVERPADVPASQWGDMDWHWLDLDLGGVEVGPWWVRSDSGLMALGPSLYDGGPVNLGSIGARPMTRVDIAVDPANMQVALAPATDQVRLDPRELVLAKQQDELEQCLEPEEPLPEEEASKPAGERCVTAYADLATIKSALGDSQGAIDAWQTITDAAANQCDNWLELGTAQIANGDASAALESFSKSSELYHAWYAMDAWDRDAAAKDFDKLSEEEQDAATVRPQASVCSRADLGLASVNFALGNEDEVARIYDEYLDLDPKLAAVYGAQLTLADEVEAAHGPWRMADHLSLSRNAWAKAGLGRLFAQQGDWDSANTNYQLAMRMHDSDSSVALMWAEDAVAALGAQDALNEARKLAAANPDDLDQLGAVARIARLSGKDPAFVTETGDTVFEEAMALYPAAPAVQASYARYLLDTGRADQAAEVIATAMEEDAHAAVLWVAKAELHELQGEPVKAKKAYARALKMSGGNPAITLLAPKAR